MGTQIVLTVTTKNNVVFTQEAKGSYDIKKQPELFFSNLNEYIRQYSLEFNKANADKIFSISVTKKDDGEEIFGVLAE